MIQIQALQTIETIQQHHPSLLTPMLHQVFSYMIQTFGSKNSPMATTILPAQTLYHSISNLCLLKAQPSNDVYIMMDQLIRNELICINNNNNHDNNNSSTIEYNFRKWEEWVPSTESLQVELEQMKNQMQATVKLLRKFSYLTILKSIKSKLVENGLINNTFSSNNNNNNNNNNDSNSSRRDVLLNNGTILPLQKFMLVYWFRQFCTFCIPVAPQQVIQYLSQQQNSIMMSLRVEPIMRNNCCDMIKISFPPPSSTSSLSSSVSNQLSQANSNNNNNNNKENVQVVNTSTTISMNNSVQYQYHTPMNNLLKPSQTVQQQNQQQQHLQGDYTNCCMMMSSNPSAIQQKKCKRKYSATSMMMMMDDEQPSDNGVVVVSQLLAPDSNKRIRLF